MRQSNFYLLFLLMCTFQLSAQQKKQLTHDEFSSWLEIKNTQLSNDGKFATYEFHRGDKGDTQLIIYDVSNGKTNEFGRGTKAQISADNAFVAFNVKPFQDSVRATKRRKVDKKDLPKDTLVIYDVAKHTWSQISNVKSYKTGKNWGDYLFYQFEPVPPPADTSTKDSTVVEVEKDKVKVMSAKTAKRKKAGKKASKKNGFPLVVHHWSSGETDTFNFVKDYQLAEDAAGLIAHTSGKDSTLEAGVYSYRFDTREWKPIHRSEGDYKHLTLSKDAQQMAFLADTDTTEAQLRPFALYHYDTSQDAAELKLDDAADFLPDTWRISENGKPYFSEDGKRLYFGTATQPILQDTSLLDDEIVNVEVWHYQDQYLHTQQKVNLERDKKRTYRAVLDLESGKAVQLANKTMNTLRLGDEGKSNIALGIDQDRYGAAISWAGFPQAADFYAVDVSTGKATQFAEAVRGRAQLSPNAEYAYWFSAPDTAWFAYSFEDKNTEKLTDPSKHYGYDEQNDRPMDPYPEGTAGWTSEGDLLMYDRYDVWQIDPENEQAPKRLTKGREAGKTYRYIRLDREEREIDTGKSALLSVFDAETKGRGYANYDFASGKLTDLLFDGDFSYSTRPVKAKEADVILMTRQNFRTFPDLLLTNTKMQSPRQISDANPQQKDYAWGTIELVEWTSLDGKKLQGMLAKPDNFDPKKKYPLLVNFYEKSSDRLHVYRTPRAGRSTINYSYYVSNGYMVFNPDVPYRDGYPGESAYNAVIPGVTALINQGFIDEERIGLQGHSWGGYQAAYLVTKTDMFACAESGAPVVNMISAYGGIRWRSGMSRMFQYEHTQSRIGGTIWDAPLRYIENSPIFFIDKINTPVLIMHNDKDGAVPWYQGIEFFVAMRRLGKPAWLLNYNNEPHWPVKLQNRQDFQRRMQQFFDHYLKDEPAPSWMKRGVPAIEKGILQGMD